MTFVLTFVGEAYAVAWALALAEVISTEVNPCAAPHTLVDCDIGLNTSVCDGISGVRYARRERLVGNIDSILTILWYGGSPCDCGIRRAKLRMSHACCAVGKRIIFVEIVRLYVGKSSASFSPSASLMVGVGVMAIIIVNDDLIALPIAFARRKHDSTRVLKHRHEEGYDNTLREEILASAEEVGTLPFPLVFLLGIIASMTCPDA